MLLLGLPYNGINVLWRQSRYPGSLSYSVDKRCIDLRNLAVKRLWKTDNCIFNSKSLDLSLILNMSLEGYPPTCIFVKQARSQACVSGIAK